MIVYALVLVTWVYSSTLTVYPDMDDCRHGAIETFKTLMLPPQSLTAPSLLCLPRYIPDPPRASLPDMGDAAPDRRGL